MPSERIIEIRRHGKDTLECVVPPEGDIVGCPRCFFFVGLDGYCAPSSHACEKYLRSYWRLKK